MIDHVSVGVSDLDEGRDFYHSVLETIGLKQLAATDTAIAYGLDKINFLIMLPFDKTPQTGGNGTHIAFKAENDRQVDAFYAAAMAQGGQDEGAPGPRDYPHAPVYAAYVRDPFGNKLEVLRGGFAA